MYEKRGETLEEFAKSINAVPCWWCDVGGHHVVHIAFVSCRASLRCAQKGGIERPTRPTPTIDRGLGLQSSAIHLGKGSVLRRESSVPAEAAVPGMHSA